MTDVRIEAGTLLANVDERTLSGLLVPYGVEGNTNLGRFTVEAGSLTLPRDPSVVTLNEDHDRERPIGRAVSLTEEEDGIHATFKFAETEEADTVLASYRDGAKTNLSVEAKNIVLRAGKAVSGLIFGAAVVEKGAFPTAALMAADIGDLDPSLPLTREEAIARAIAEFDAAHPETPDEADASADTEETTTNPEPEDPATDTESEDTVAEATVPDTLAASASSPANGISKYEAFQLLASAANGSADGARLAALQDSYTASGSLFAAQTNVGLVGGPQPYNPAPQWVGEIWDGLTAKPVIYDLLGHKDLQSRTVSGFKWATKPIGGNWAGEGAEIASGPITTQSYNYTAAYWAGGNSFSREWLDFGLDAELMSKYFEFQGENFINWLDSKALTAITAGLDTHVADDPTGLTIGAGLSALIDGATQLVTNTNGVLPTFALVKASAYKAILKTGNNSVLGYLNASLGLEAGSLSGFSIRPVPDAAMGSNLVIVGASQGADVYTLAGSPVRAESVNVANGLVSAGLYGYGLVLVNKANAFVGVTPFGA